MHSICINITHSFSDFFVFFSKIFRHFVSVELLDDFICGVKIEYRNHFVQRRKCIVEFLLCDDMLCCSPQERDAVKQLRDAGFCDPLQDKGFTWWDYRFGAFKRNIGLRIDQFYLSQKANKLFVNGDVLKAARAMEKPSDHAPIICEIGDKK